MGMAEMITERVGLRPPAGRPAGAQRIRVSAPFAVGLVVLSLWAPLVNASARPPWDSGSPLFDEQGNMYVVGTVATDSISVTAGAFQTKFNTGTCGTILVQYHPLKIEPVPCRHIFAAKLGPDGKIIFATYLQGSQDDLAVSAAVDSA